MTQQVSAPLSEALSAHGATFQTEARVARTAEYSGVFHLLSVDGTICDPPVVVIAPGKWRDETNAHQSAHRHASTMASDGALSALLQSLQR
tara:strand:- start:92267 stop:92539 length:273 start_codon:yes stop_codon:yes gene_type:complete